MSLNHELKDVSVKDIKEFFYKREHYNEDDIKELSKNIKSVSTLNEIALKPLSDNGYMVIAGSRRLKALQLNKVETVKAKIYKSITDTELFNICLSENLFTKEISKVDTANLLKQWMDTQKIKQTDIAKKLGKSSAWVSQTLKLLEVDETTKNAISKGTLTAEHARVLEVLPNNKARQDLSKKVETEGLSVNETTRLINKKIARMDIEKKVEKLEDSITEYKDKIKAAISSESDLKDNEISISEMELKNKKLSKLITDKAINEKQFRIKVIDSNIRPLENSITEIKAEINEFNESLSKIDLESLNKDKIKVTNAMTAQAKKVETAKAAYEKAKNLLSISENSLKLVSKSILDHGIISKRVTAKQSTLNKKTIEVNDLIKDNKEYYDSYDDIIAEISNYSKESSEIKDLTAKINDLTSKNASLRGKANNITNHERKLAEFENELEKLKELENKA